MGRLRPVLYRPFLMAIKYTMQYYLYTTVDITNTGQYRSEQGKEDLRWKEQNFQTIIQTLGIRSNVSFSQAPKLMELAGNVVGFKTNKIIHVWYFEFETERDFIYENDGDPVGYLKQDFSAIPYISGLDESMEQNYDIFVTEGPATNIVFFQKL